MINYILLRLPLSDGLTYLLGRSIRIFCLTVGGIVRKKRILRSTHGVPIAIGMTSHVHMIVGSKGRALDKIIGEMESFTSRSLRKAIESNHAESRREWLLPMMRKAGLQNGNNKDWQLWQQHNHPIELTTLDIFYQTLAYIHQNPVEAGFVSNEEDYLYSSSGDFHDKKGLIELCYVV